MVQEQLMKGVNIFPILISGLIASKVNGLWSLPLLLLDFTFTHADLHAGFGESLHGWSSQARFVA